MAQVDIADIQAWMDGDPLPQMLFEDQTLRLFNPSLKALWPEAETGMEAGQVFGPDAEAFTVFSGQGSMIFSAELAGQCRDFQMTLWRSFIRITVLKSPADSTYGAMESMARSILGPLSNMMAVAPKLLPVATEGGDAKTIRWAAQLNQGLYTMMRTADHMRTCSGPLNIPVNQKPVDLCRWVRDLIADITPLMEASHRKIRMKLPRREYMCMIDGDKLQQAVLNIVSNSIKYTQEDAVIEFSMKTAGSDRMCLTIQDWGCGISPGRMASVFSMEQDREQIPDPRQGAELGLPIARAILQAHGGNLLLESQEGQGTIVYLYLRRTKVVPEMQLHSDVKYPVPSNGFSPILVELADALPSRVFDSRDID